MNYLTHFLIDHEKNRPLYNFGLALPDLINVAQRGWKPAKGNDLSIAPHDAKEIWSGFQQHLKADASFHNIPLFTSHSKRLRRELENAGLTEPGVRLFFAAHVLLEMLIDRHIVKTRRNIVDMFYENIEQVKEVQIESFFHASGTPIPAKFLEFFERFRESRYLFEYEKDKGLYYSLNRLLGRAKQPAYTTEEQERAFFELFHREEQLLYNEIENFFEVEGVR
jgi:hypothetical protein